MTSGPPDFRPAEGKPDSIRIQRLETWAGGYVGWAGSRSDELGRQLLDLHERVAKLEAWKVDVLLFVGATKIRWGYVNLLTGLVSAIATAGAIKLFGLL